MRRPLVSIALAFVVGIILEKEFALSFWMLFTLAIGALGLAGCFWRKDAFRQAALLLAVLSLGALGYLGARLPAEAPLAASTRWDYIQGVVASYPFHGERYTSFLLKPREAPGYLRVFYFHDPKRGSPMRIDYGDELRLYAEVKEPENFNNFNYREHLLRRGVWGVVSVWSASQFKRIATEGGNPLLRWGYRLREALFARLDPLLGERSGLLKALLFGERGYLAEEVEEQFRDAGVAHVLAVSGLHLGILLTLLLLILRAVRLPLEWTYAVAVLAVSVYLMIVGFRVSLVRAALLFFFLSLSWLLSARGLILRRWADPYQGLSAAGLAILALNPQALFDVSFQLSFSATLGIIALARPFEEGLKFLKPRALRGLVAVTLAAQLGVIPFIAWWFRRLYLLVILANLVVIPLVTLALWGGVILIALSPLPLLKPLGVLEGWLLEGLRQAAALLARFPCAYLEVRSFMPLLVCYLALVGGLLLYLYLRLRRVR